MSHNFRDLERPDSPRRKDAVLMAAISELECLDHPTRQDMSRFSRLFLPLYAAASTDIKRTASATLSRLARVPDDVAEMLINEPIAIAAPFIAHYQVLKESALSRAVARNGAPHARAAARRSDLSPEAISALRRLRDPSVEGLLILRGLIPDPATETGRAPNVAPVPAPGAAPVAKPRAAPVSAPPASARPVVDSPPMDPSEKLRQQLRLLAQRSPAAKPALPAKKPIIARIEAAAERPGRRAPSFPLNREISARTRSTQEALPDPVSASAAEARRASSSSPQRRIAEVRLAQLARYAKRDQETWFATALADAMEASFALAERIMMDLSGRQLATALIGLNAPESIIKSALETFFPHLGKPSAKQTLATDLISELDLESCAARLATWQRADAYTTGASAHVPALADSKPARREPFQREAPKDAKTARTTRKSG